jgi:outer membrane protein OmpA-like peptidoglycan-associated protein
MNTRRFAPLLMLLLAACAGTPPSSPPRTVSPPASPALPGITPPAAAPVTTPVPAPPPPAPGSAEQRTALAAELTVEQQWLDSFFKGTPVQIRQRDDGALWVDVPREFCFDTGRSNVKPALAAVLDKLAESLRRRPSAIVTLVSAPDDKPGNTPLALQRAAQVHKHLRDRGVPLARMGEPRAASGSGVQLRIVAPPG